MGAARVGHRQQHFTGVSGHLGGQLRIGPAHRISIADHRRHATTGGSHPEVFVDLAEAHRSGALQLCSHQYGGGQGSKTDRSESG